MKKMILAGLFVAMTSAFAPTLASADVVTAKQHSTITTGNPMDSNARMRDKSSYGSPSAGRMRTGMRNRYGYRSSKMMRRDRMMMRRDMGRRSMKRDPSAFGTPMSKRIRR
jgi:hypothetical protein